MAVTALVQEYLRQANVAYSVFPHRPAFSAQEEAAVTHISGRDWAKPVVFYADGEPIQAVVPADLVVRAARPVPVPVVPVVVWMGQSQRPPLQA